jgi:hypothetical protein
LPPAFIGVVTVLSLYHSPFSRRNGAQLQQQAIVARWRGPAQGDMLLQFINSTWAAKAASGNNAMPMPLSVRLAGGSACGK